MQKTSSFCKIICIYILIMILGMFISNFFVILNKPTTFWLFNLFGFVIFVSGYLLIQRSLNKEMTVLALLFFLFSILTLAFHNEHLFDDKKSIGLNINILVVSFSLIIFCNDSLKKELTNYDIIVVNRLILLIGVVSTLYNLFFSGFSFNSILNSNNIYTVASRSFFDSKNTFGIYSLFSFVSGVFLIFKDKYKKTIFILLLIQFFSLIISFSRSALLLFFVFLIIFMIFSIKSNSIFSYKEKNIIKYVFLILFFVVIGITLLYIFNNSFNVFVNKAIIRSDFGDAGRGNIWHSGIELINFNKFIDIFFGIGWSELNSNGYSYLHNIYLEIFVVGGIIKVLYYIFIIIYGFNLFIKKRKNSFVNLFGLSILISYLIYGFFESQIIFELGITPFLFVLFIFIIPQNYDYGESNEF